MSWPDVLDQLVKAWPGLLALLGAVFSLIGAAGAAKSADLAKAAEMRATREAEGSARREFSREHAAARLEAERVTDLSNQLSLRRRGYDTFTGNVGGSRARLFQTEVTRRAAVVAKSKLELAAMVTTQEDLEQMSAGELTRRQLAVDQITLELRSLKETVQHELATVIADTAAVSDLISRDGRL